MRPGEARGIRPHRRQSRRIAEQPVDVPREGREVVAPDRRASLEQMDSGDFPGVLREALRAARY